MPRKKRPLDRTSQVRDASLIVIASEDRYAVRHYFARFRTTRVKFVVIETKPDQSSSPEAVMNRLDAYKNAYDIGPEDQFWLCIDRDHWADANHIANLRQVLQRCRQKGYQVAISNPCFELWLLLHFEDVASHTPVDGKAITNRLALAAKGYNKTRGNLLAIDASGILAAVARARTLDVNDAPIPETVVTRVYRIVLAMNARQVIDLH